MCVYVCVDQADCHMWAPLTTQALLGEIHHFIHLCLCLRSLNIKYTLTHTLMQTQGHFDFLIRPSMVVIKWERAMVHIRLLLLYYYRYSATAQCMRGELLLLNQDQEHVTARPVQAYSSGISCTVYDSYCASMTDVRAVTVALKPAPPSHTC